MALGPTTTLVDGNGNPLVTATAPGTPPNSLPTSINGPTATDPYAATVTAWGELRASGQAAQLLQYGFDTTTLNTANVWKTPTAAGGGVAATNALTNTQIGTGTTANGYSYLESQASFPPVNPGWLLFYTGINIPFPYVANTYFFWGLGTSPATPTALAPLTNACGFEVAIGGKMAAVTYQSGSRILIQDLSSTGNNKQPLDANVHKYYVYYKGDNIYWAIDGVDNIVAFTTTGAPGPDVNILPIKFQAIAGSIAPASSGVLTVNTVTLADTAGNNIQIADATYPWRQTLVTADGALSVREALYNLPVAAGVGTAAVVVKSSPGYLKGVVVTATGTAALSFYDNASTASGTVIGIVPASATLGQYLQMEMPAGNGVVAGQLSGTPAVTASVA